MSTSMLIQHRVTARLFPGRAQLQLWTLTLPLMHLLHVTITIQLPPQTGLAARLRGLRRPSAAVRRRLQRPHAGCLAQDASRARKTTSHGATAKYVHQCFLTICHVRRLCRLPCIMPWQCVCGAYFNLDATVSMRLLRLPVQVFAPSSEASPEPPASLSCLPLPSERVSADSASGQVRWAPAQRL